MIQFVWNNLTVMLKSPEWNDSIGLRTNVQIKRAMDRTTYSFKAVDRNRIINWTFQHLSRTQVRNFFNFMRVSKGTNVTIFVENERINPEVPNIARWWGTITTVPIASTHLGINNSNLNITFEGIQVA